LAHRQQVTSEGTTRFTPLLKHVPHRNPNYF